MIAQEKALKTYGIDRQLRKLAEECAELAAAALHAIDRTGEETLKELYEEIADVEIMLDQMRMHYGDTAIDAQRSRKLSRLEKQLGIKTAEFSPYNTALHAAGHRPTPEAETPKPRALALPRPGPRKDKRRGGRKAREVWVDGERFGTVAEAKQRFGSGLHNALSGGRTYKGHVVSYEPQAGKAEA